jgi:hypothetical protein
VPLGPLQRVGHIAVQPDGEPRLEGIGIVNLEETVTRLAELLVSPQNQSLDVRAFEDLEYRLLIHVKSS